MIIAPIVACIVIWSILAIMYYALYLIAKVVK